MISTKEIQEIITFLPSIFIYVVPGYLFLKAFNYVVSWNKTTFKENIFEYIIISYILCSIQKFLLSIFFSNVYLNTPGEIICLLIESCILGFLCGKFIISKWYSKIRKKLNIKRTINNSVLGDIVDKDSGTWARVYLKDEKIVYDGAIVLINNKDKIDEAFIVMNMYSTYSYGTANINENMLVDDPKKENFVTLKLKDIYRIETSYKEDSNLLKDWSIN